MPEKIGLLVGREWSFPPAFIEAVKRLDAGVEVEYVKLGTPRMDDPVRYALIVDRISHEIPFYRTYLKHAALAGVAVINDPFLWGAADRFFAASLAARLGLATPKTIILPHREYADGIVHEESLRNLDYPLDWQAVADHVGLPCVLKAADDSGRRYLHVCHSVEELLYHYDASGRLLLVAQEMIGWDHFVRCIVVGQEKVLPLKFDPMEQKYHVDHAHLDAGLGERIVAGSRALAHATGYDLCSIDWAIRGHVPYLLDFPNAVPELDLYALTPHYFEWVVDALAETVVERVRNPRRRAIPILGSDLPAAAGEGAAGDGRDPAPAHGDGAGDLAEELPSLARGLPRTKLQS